MANSDAVPPGPQDGQALRYRIEDNQVVNYSVGKDCRDDGGHCDPVKREPDIAVEVKLLK